MSKQQTAVEWLESKFEKYTSSGVNVPNCKIFKLTEKAKKKEREQITESFMSGSEWSIFPDDTPINEMAEQYYKETYE